MTEIRAIETDKPQAVETPEGGAVLVDRAGNVIEHLQVFCPTCGRHVESIFDHIDEDCQDWPEEGDTT